MTGYGNIAKTKQDGSWVKYVFSLMPEKRKKNNQAVLSLLNDLLSLVLQNRSSKYWRTIRNTFGLFEKHFSKANESKKDAKYISDRRVSGLFLSNEDQFIPWRLCF